jgi:hypothetical protein
MVVIEMVREVRRLKRGTSVPSDSMTARAAR